ncbi:MAG: quinone-dependent dihydroorotate dehydrogenase [Acidiferrobacterales bacterium]
MYKLIRPLLFLLDAERSHDLTFLFVRWLYHVPGFGTLIRVLQAKRTPMLPVEAMGLHFPNPVGLAAGLDKNARQIRPLQDLGFGFIELGTVTPRPQAGNPKARLFRIPTRAALINRMGFNNVGVEQFLDSLHRQEKQGIVGINIGKNKATSDEGAVEDYLEAFRAVYAHADYVTINISSPNTPGLRDLQDEQRLEKLLLQLKHEQVTLGKTRRVYVPVALKIAPDIDDAQIAVIARLALTHKVDAIIATNTTLSRPEMEDMLAARETGGLSGRPLRDISTTVVRKLYAHLKGQITIIGVGGVETADDAWEKLVAGADLIQIYTSLIYGGPGVVRRIVTGLARRVKASGYATLAETVAQARTGPHLMK